MYLSLGKSFKNSGISVNSEWYKLLEYVKKNF